MCNIAYFRNIDFSDLNDVYSDINLYFFIPLMKIVELVCILLATGYVQIIKCGEAPSPPPPPPADIFEKSSKEPVASFKSPEKPVAARPNPQQPTKPVVSKDDLQKVLGTLRKTGVRQEEIPYSAEKNPGMVVNETRSQSRTTDPNMPGRQIETTRKSFTGRRTYNEGNPYGAQRTESFENMEMPKHNYAQGYGCTNETAKLIENDMKKIRNEPDLKRQIELLEEWIYVYAGNLQQKEHHIAFLKTRLDHIREVAAMVVN